MKAKRGAPKGKRKRLTPVNGEVMHLRQEDLARRWQISARTLERWRWLKQGPAYVKIGGAVVYRIKDIEAYERQRTTDSLAP